MKPVKDTCISTKLAHSNKSKNSINSEKLDGHFSSKVVHLFAGKLTADATHCFHQLIMISK